MLLLVALAMGFFILTCGAVGVRLLFMAARTRQTPELYCGLGFACIGLIGYPASLVSGNGTATVGEMWHAAYALGMVFTNAGIAAFYFFTWRVFRSTRSGAAVVGLACLALCIGSIGAIWSVYHADPGIGSMQATRSWNRVLQIASVIAFAWTSIEGALQARSAGRRVRLGLTDALTLNRFWLWCLFGTSTTVLSVVFLMSQALGRVPAQDPVVHFSSALFGGLSSIAMALAFFPPAAYARWIRGASPSR